MSHSWQHDSNEMVSFASEIGTKFLFIHEKPEDKFSPFKQNINEKQ